ncbi:unnamed protein product [Mytilus edulis]|uniref:Uncharacterized protein n=1 Tax=Mytilus edulis TaxID=6550 RepID=A0A8S3S3G0_MYTED|nr:unnamed protein product [Mytilus edulis]
MLWLENPGNYYTPWRPTVIAHGPDIFVIDAVLNTTDGPQDCLTAAQFFTSSLTIYWVENKIANWTDASKIESRVIDNSIGNVFDVTVADLNNDGKSDLLVTNNGEIGSLYAYEVPSVFRSGDFKRHSIATGFKPGKSGTGKGAHGAAMPVYPNTKVNASKPSILLSGDDDGKAYYLEPVSGIFQKEDFESYSVKESSGIQVDLGDMLLLTHGAPSGGPVMGLTMKILEGMGINEDSMKDTPSKALAYHKMIEAIKLSYGERFKLGDEDFVDGVKELVEKMISEKFAANLRRKIDLTKTHDIEYYANATEAAHDEGTAHVSVFESGRGCCIRNEHS